MDKQFAKEIKMKIGESVEVSKITEKLKTIKTELSNTEKQVRNIEKEIDSLIETNKNTDRRRKSLNRRLDVFLINKMN